MQRLQLNPRPIIRTIDWSIRRIGLSFLPLDGYAVAFDHGAAGPFPRNDMLKHVDWLWAVLAGVLLATMVTINSGLAAHTTPFTASWVVHGVGAVAAFVLLMANLAIGRRTRRRKPGRSAPLWTYLGGAPGAFAVALSSIAVNSELALAGGLSLLLVGQILFGLLSDQFGLFGTPKRGLNRFDFLSAACVIGGSALLIFSKGA